MVTLLGCECGIMLCEQTAQCTTSCRMLSRFTYLWPAGANGTLSGTPAVIPPWLAQGEVDTEGTPAAQAHPTGSASSTGATQPIECISQTANKSPSELGSKPDSQADLFLPASGLPPIPGHLVQAIKDYKFVDLATCSQRHCKRPNLTGSATKRTTPRRKRSTQSLHQWTGWCP